MFAWVKYVYLPDLLHFREFEVESLAEDVPRLGLERLQGLEAQTVGSVDQAPVVEGVI